MNGPHSLLLAAATALLLAGCSGPVAEAPFDALRAADLEEGGFYAFRHGGGDLSFGMAGAGSADLVLFDAGDERVGRIVLDDARSSARFVVEGLGAGDLVVQLVGLEGTLDVRSGGAAVRAFHALPIHVERHVLLQRPLDTVAQLGLGILPQGSPADATVELELLRAPAALHLLALGSYGSLDVRIEGHGGTVLVAEDPGATVQPSFATFGFMQVPAESRAENVRDGRFTARASAESFQGVLLLEAVSFSRARPVAADLEATDLEPRFTYGVLPDQPVAFDVRSGTERLYLFQESEEAEACRGQPPGETGPDDPGGPDAPSAPGKEECSGDAAVVALFGPHDERVAVVHVPLNRTVTVPATAPGEWVAVLLAGEATLGADAVPADFELHPLDIVRSRVPAQVAGNNGNYGQSKAEVRPGGVPYRATPSLELGGPFAGLTSGQCGPASLSLLQGGETLGAWGHAAATSAGPVDDLLDGSPLTVVHDGFGAQCDQMALLVEGYER